jgi:hypothetical protein
MFQRRVARTHRARGAFVEALGALGEHVLEPSEIFAQLQGAG